MINGMNSLKLGLIFVFGCLFGTCHEELFVGMKNKKRIGKFQIETRKGVLYGPFYPVYGIGAVVFSLFLPGQHLWYQTFLLGAILGGIVEYVSSFLQEFCFGTMTWDYRTHFMNLQGRTSLPIMVGWGVLGLFFNLIYPYLSNGIDWFLSVSGNVFPICLIGFLFLDLAFTLLVLLRQRLREDQIPPYTILGDYIDQYYSDEVLKKHFPNKKRRV